MDCLPATLGAGPGDAAAMTESRVSKNLDMASLQGRLKATPRLVTFKLYHNKFVEKGRSYIIVYWRVRSNPAN